MSAIACRCIFGEAIVRRCAHARGAAGERQADARVAASTSSSPRARGPTIRPRSTSRHERIRDSDSILRYGQHPFSVTIYGAGVIGCEYASIFINLGAKVTLVNTQDRLLSFLDDEIAEALSYHLREQGCVIRHNEQFKALEARERDVVLHLESGRKIKSDLLLWANGRTGNSNELQARERVGLTSQQRGQIAVNRHYQTAVPHIYAVGDIVGPPALASAAYVQGSHAVAAHARSAQSRRIDWR